MATIDFEKILIASRHPVCSLLSAPFTAVIPTTRGSSKRWEQVPVNRGKSLFQMWGVVQCGRSGEYWYLWERYCVPTTCIHTYTCTFTDPSSAKSDWMWNSSRNEVNCNMHSSRNN